MKITVSCRATFDLVNVKIRLRNNNIIMVIIVVIIPKITKCLQQVVVISDRLLHWAVPELFVE